MKIQDIKTYYICPAHNEKYMNRKLYMEKLLQNLGFTNFQHQKSSTEDYPSCLSKAMIDILQQNLNQEPILILEDDVEFTGVDDVYFDSETDAVQIGLSKSSASMSANRHSGSAVWVSISEDQVRLMNMLSLHAKIQISKEYKLSTIEVLQNAIALKEYNDVHVARNLQNFFIRANKKPSFFQSDSLENDPRVRVETEITFL